MAQPKKAQQKLAHFYMYDPQKKKTILAKSNKKYIEKYVDLHKRLYNKKKWQTIRPKLKLQARQQLAASYTVTYSFHEARKQYDKLIAAGEAAGYVGLAQTAYIEQHYALALYYLNKMEEQTAESLLLKAKVCRALGLTELVFSTLQQAYTLAPHDLEVLKMHAQVFEHYYRTALPERHYALLAIQYYVELFEQHFFGQPAVTFERWHLLLGHLVVLLLETKKEQQALRIIARYFKQMPFGEQTLHRWRDITYTVPHNVQQLAQKQEQLELQQAYKKVAIKSYTHLTLLLLELRCYAYLISGQRDDALQTVQLLQAKAAKTSATKQLELSVKRLTQIQRGDVKFHSATYVTRLQTIEAQIDIKLTKGLHPIITRTILPTLQSLEAQPKSIRHCYNVRRLLALDFYQQQLPAVEQAASLVEQTIEQLAPHALKCYKRLFFLEMTWLQRTLPQLAEQLAEAAISEQQWHDVLRLPNVQTLWQQAEQLYTIAPQFAQEDPKQLAMVGELYVYVAQCTLVKLLGSSMAGQSLQPNFTIGSLPYYADVQLKHYTALFPANEPLQQLIQWAAKLKSEPTITLAQLNDVRASFYHFMQRTLPTIQS